MSPDEELIDLLARLVGFLKPEDLSDDPELTGMMAQLIQILEPPAAPVPLDLFRQLSSIDSALDRFKVAAGLIQANTPEKMKQLADSLKQAGLLKVENEPSN